MNPFRYTLACRELPGDLHTPVSAYLRLRDASTRSILMESSDFHAGREARSFIALEPPTAPASSACRTGPSAKDPSTKAIRPTG